MLINIRLKFIWIIPKDYMAKRNWGRYFTGYDALHNWVRRRKPKPAKCIKCNKRPPRVLACIDDKYTRNVNNFLWLCDKCHWKYDHLEKKGKEVFYTSKRIKSRLEDYELVTNTKPVNISDYVVDYDFINRIWSRQTT